ncbi:hypothetical protein OIE69_43970 (plasmid) [Actinacidiphila glaucinigra]|uniref:hypothetical protein n=1 Tax=Actinacidiphila glaucinigra TaxID=235986 RepID=UPI002DDB58FD|nr:hypothetical protein [Actinacidiphila glaucinigra]WSD65863.1 hypothetical protein OIE69_43970 [Actinacidiphila glaucinigra]
MTAPSNATAEDERPRLSAAQAVALTLLRDGSPAATIQRRTGIALQGLYPLAVAWQITAPCGTVEGAECHIARGEDTCKPCQRVKGKADAQARAQRKIRDTRRQVTATRTSHRPQARNGRPRSRHGAAT